jgi:hypothetical protein
MATPFSNTFDVTNPGSGVGNREDLREGMNLLAPEDTPFISTARSETASARKVDWLVDSLSAPTNQGFPEGSDLDTFTDQFANQVRLSNDIQGLSRDYKVSNVQEAVASAGPVNVARAESKAMMEVRRDVEFTCLGVQDKKLQTTPSDVYQMRGLGKWLSNPGPSDVPSDYQTPAESLYTGTLANFTETTLLQMITSIYKQNGNVNDLTLLAGPALRNAISDFSRLAEAPSGKTVIRRIDGDMSMAEITNSIDLYRSNHGVINIANANPVCIGEEQGFLINPSMVGVAELIPFGNERLPKNRGGERGYIDWWGTVVVNNLLAHGQINCSSSADPSAN